MDYKVYLKKNDFFDTPYLEKDMTYITSLIDYINLDFDYNVAYDYIVNGEYRYYLYAVIESKQNNKENKLWHEEYKLMDEVKKELKNATEYNIKENIDIDYNKYNDRLISFKKTLNLNSAEGLLKIYLKLTGDIEGKQIKIPIENNILLLKMPLSELTINATVESNSDSNVKEISKVVNSERLKTNKILGVIYLIGTISCIILFFVMSKKRRDLNKYENMLKKILNTYDSIIVNVKKIPDVRGYKTIYVDTFEELLDAHGEVRMPINYYKDTGKSYFILLNDSTAWIYVMSKRKIERM